MKSTRDASLVSGAEKNKGCCFCRDGLKPVLDAIRASDGLIIGSPNYLSEMTASFRALYERLIFQNLTYNKDTPCCNAHMIPVLLIMTSNAPDMYYTDLMRNYQQTLSRFVGPTEVFICGDTLQLKDYSKLDWPWSIFDPEAKKIRHDTVFPQDCRKVFEMGAALVKLVWMPLVRGARFHFCLAECRSSTDAPRMRGEAWIVSLEGLGL